MSDLVESTRPRCTTTTKADFRTARKVFFEKISAAAVVFSIAIFIVAQFTGQDVVRLPPRSGSSSGSHAISGQRMLLGTALTSWSASLRDYESIRMYVPSQLSLLRIRPLPILLILLRGVVFPVIFVSVLLLTVFLLFHSMFCRGLRDVCIPSCGVPVEPGVSDNAAGLPGIAIKNAF